jgi:hypothetical protein
MELSPSWEAANCVATQELPSSYGTWRFITVFTRVLHWSLSRVRSIESIPPHPVPQRSILMLSTHQCLGLPSGLFPTGFPIKTLYAFLFSPHACYMPCPSHPRVDHCNYTWWRVQVMKLLIMQSSPTSHHFISLQSKYSPQHTVLKQPQSVFLP